MTDMEYYFRVERLDVGYNRKPVVRNVEVSIGRGQILTLIGPNGSGKSTILKSVAGQLKTIGGRVFIGGGGLHETSPRELSRKAAVVLTERPRPELLTCGDVVAVGRYPYTGTLGLLSASDREKIDEALDTVNALELKDRYFGEISDGQIQRVMLARAICQEPEIIILDEPTSFLDIRCAVDILDILRRMANDRLVTVVMSLHELIYARRISDIVMCVKEGYVMRLDSPKNIFTEELISELYDLPPGTYRSMFGNNN